MDQFFIFLALSPERSVGGGVAETVLEVLLNGQRLLQEKSGGNHLAVGRAGESRT
jgi:hypothetical protein